MGTLNTSALGEYDKALAQTIDPPFTYSTQLAGRSDRRRFAICGKIRDREGFVFAGRQAAGAATDWSSYYKAVPYTAKLARRYTTAVLLQSIQLFCRPKQGTSGLAIVEIGGANSCFLDAILSNVDCSSYDVVDTNEYGLSLLANRLGPSESRVRLHNQSVLALTLHSQADLVFSVGLVEHFNPRETRDAVLAHFALLRPGGTAIITFPTPTPLYRATRGLIQMLRMWKFPDERPLPPQEVLSTVREHADLLHEKTLWPLLLTQELIVAKKRPLNPRDEYCVAHEVQPLAQDHD